MIIGVSNNWNGIPLLENWTQMAMVKLLGFYSITSSFPRRWHYKRDTTSALPCFTKKKLLLYPPPNSNAIFWHGGPTQQFLAPPCGWRMMPNSNGTPAWWQCITSLQACLPYSLLSYKLDKAHWLCLWNCHDIDAIDTDRLIASLGWPRCHGMVTLCLCRV